MVRASSWRGQNENKSYSSLLNCSLCLPHVHNLCVRLDSSLRYSTRVTFKKKPSKGVKGFFFLSTLGLWVNTGFVWEHQLFPVNCDADKTVWKWYQHFERFFSILTTEWKSVNNMVKPNKWNLFSAKGKKKSIFLFSLLNNVYLPEVCHKESVILKVSSASVPVYKFILRLWLQKSASPF